MVKNFLNEYSYHRGLTFKRSLSRITELLDGQFPQIKRLLSLAFSFSSFFRIFSSRYCKWGKIMRIWNPSIDLPTYLCFDHLEMFWQINLLSWLSGAFLFDLDARLRLWSFKILSSDVALIIILQKVPRTFVKKPNMKYFHWPPTQAKTIGSDTFRNPLFQKVFQN